jgi:hypothetical protein
MLERSEGLADSTKHHIQEIQGISPQVSDRSSNQSTHLDSHFRSRSKKTTTLSSVD